MSDDGVLGDDVKGDDVKGDDVKNGGVKGDDVKSDAGVKDDVKSDAGVKSDATKAEDTAATQYPSQPKKPSYRRPRDMFFSLAVLLIPIGLFFGLWKVLFDGATPREVSPSEDFSIAYAHGLEATAVATPEDWTVTSSVVNTDDETDIVTLRVGYVDDEKIGYQLIYTTGDIANVNASLNANASDGQVTVEDLDWDTYTSDQTQTWVTYAEDNEVIILVGEADHTEQMEKLANAVAQVY